ncbi:MAG: sensor histidine kinase [Verrucomicrobiota bacterium]
MQSAHIHPRSDVLHGLAFVVLTLALIARAEPALRTAAEVQALSPEQARKHLEVRLKGVITFAWHAGTTEFTVQDETGAIWMPPILLPANCAVGTKVEIEGRTEAGGFGPIVQAEIVRAFGPGPLPGPRPASYEELLTSQFQGQRVELTGIVRGQRVNPEFGLGWLALEIAAGGGRVTVNVTHEITGHPELLDARVRVRGVNLQSSDAQQQGFLPMINAHTLADVDVLAPANPQPFAQPSVALNQMMRSANPAGAGHRVRVHGAVTVVRQGNSFFLQDETRGLQVFLRESSCPETGEIVDVVGFPEPGAFSPVLRDADWRPTGAKNSPSALVVDSSEAVKHDGQLITVRAQLTTLAATDNEIVLTLEDGPLRFRAHVPDANLGRWRVGSELQTTGVCSVEVGDWESLVTHRQPQGFSLLVCAPGDIVLLRAGPLWTPNRIVWALVAVGLALGVALGLVWMQTRRRLREAARTREAAHAQFEAVIGERTRMAREIHDTLAQGFAGISVQLEVLNDRLGALPGDTRRHLDLARNLVRSSLDEARRTVWNLRAQTLEENGLPGALDRLGRQLTEDSRLDFNFHVEGVARTLPADVENNLLRIGQEAITNAVRHSGARRTTLTLIFRADVVRLCVSDNGHGFDSSNIQPSRHGGFGLPGLRERAEAMHAQLEIHTTPGSGTQIEITVPHV